MAGAIAAFLCAKAVISTNESSKYGLKVLQLSEKAPAAPCQGRDIMPQVSVDTFHGESIIFALNIENVLSREDHVQIAAIPTRAVSLRFLAAYPEQPAYSSADFLKRLVKIYAHRGNRVECVQTDNGSEFPESVLKFRKTVFLSSDKRFLC